MTNGRAGAILGPYSGLVHKTTSVIYPSLPLAQGTGMEEDQKPKSRRQGEGEGETAAMATPKTPGDNEQNTKGVEDKVCHIGPFKHWTPLSTCQFKLTERSLTLCNLLQVQFSLGKVNL